MLDRPRDEIRVMIEHIVVNGILIVFALSVAIYDICSLVLQLYSNGFIFTGEHFPKYCAMVFFILVFLGFGINGIRNFISDLRTVFSIKKGIKEEQKQQLLKAGRGVKYRK